MSDMISEAKVVKRPLLITIICVWGFIGSGINVLGILIPTGRNSLALQYFVQQYGSTALFIATVGSILNLVAFVGCWNMRKWGLFLYATVTILCFISSVLLKMESGLLSYILPIILLCIIFSYRKQMR